MEREIVLVELSGGWLARLDVDNGNPPAVAVSVISEADADALATIDTDTPADTLASCASATIDAGAEAVAIIESDTPAEAVAIVNAAPVAPVAVVNRRQLAAAVKRLAATVGGKKSKPVFRGVSVAIDAGAVFLSTTDAEAEAVAIIESDTPAGVRIRETLVDFATFRAAVNATKSAEIKIDATDADALAVGSSRIPTTGNADEIPRFTVDGLQKSASVMIDAATLAETLAAVVGATDSESTRYALEGVRLEIGAGGFVRTVGTDGRRLHFAESGAEPDTVAAAVIPARAVAAVVDAATAAGGSVCVEFFTRPTATDTATDADADTDTPAEPVATATEADTLAAGFVFFNSAGVNVGELWARTIEGRFPNWRAIFKTEYNEIGRVDVAGLASSASSARQLIKSAGDETNAIVISDGGGFVELVSPGWSRVSFLYSVAASTVPAFVPLTFDCRYLAELATAAARVSSDCLAFSVSESGAAHFETTGARVRFRGLIMPIVNKRPKPAAEADTPAEAVATDADTVAAG